MSANNAEALVCGALAGLGIAHLPTWLASEYLVRGELLPLFCENGLPSPETTGIYALRTGTADQLAQPLVAGIPQVPFQPGAAMGSGAAAGAGRH